MENKEEPQASVSVFARVRALLGRMKGTPDEPNAPRDIGAQLAYDRTRLAYDRTMMAWIRTGTSLISFGFTIYKFFDFEMQKGDFDITKLAPTFIGPRQFAATMIVVGMAALILGTLEHRQNLHQLHAEGANIPRSLATLVASLVSILGLVALLAVVFRQ